MLRKSQRREHFTCIWEDSKAVPGDKPQKCITRVNNKNGAEMEGRGILENGKYHRFTLDGVLSVCTEGLDRNPGLQVPSNSAGGSACWLVASLHTAKSTVPKSKSTRHLPPEFLPHLDKLFWVTGPAIENLETWSPQWQLHSKVYLLQLLQTLHEPPILDICALSRNFKLLNSSWFFFFSFLLLSPEESLLTPQS